VNLRFIYYCTWNFVIHGAQELRNANDIDFSLHKDEFGSFLEVMSCIVFYFSYFIFGVQIFYFLVICLDIF